MIINKDYMQVMRAGKNWNRYSLEKQNDSGMILGVCLLCAIAIIIAGLLWK